LRHVPTPRQALPIILDRNFFDIPAAEIADIKVLQTVVGGRVVFQSDEFAQP